MRIGTGSMRIPGLWLTLVFVSSVPAGNQRAMAQDEVGRVTMMTGGPRMVGESIRPLQAILSGRMLETGEDDAAGVLTDDVVFHIGPNSQVTIIEEGGRKRAVIEKGYVVFYTEPSLRTEMVLETPFGRLTVRPGDFSVPVPGGAETEGDTSGWFSARHDPEQSGVRPAVSTFSAMEGTAEVVGTAPGVGPFELPAGHRWRVVQGQLPGAPEEGDDSAEAEALSDSLHREAASLLRGNVVDVPQFTEITPTFRPTTVVTPTGQAVIDSNAANQNQQVFRPVSELQDQFAIGPPTDIPAGDAFSAVAEFQPVVGTPTNPDFNLFLTAVNGLPAYQPLYVQDFVNGGFSYVQFAGTGAQVVSQGGETFLADTPNNADGWALYTPTQIAIDSGFDPNAPVFAVVNEGFQAIARGDHLNGGGMIGGGGDAGSAFVVNSGGDLMPNANQPAGYPQLDLANNVADLAGGGAVPSDQVAALGAGLDPQNLANDGPRLTFVSDSNVDAQGNSFNFDGEAIAPTDLNLPGDRSLDNVPPVADGSASVATPLAPGGDSTVGIQFAATGDTIAIIHHTGVAAITEGTVQVGDHFEVVHEARDTVIRWRSDGRVTGSDGQNVEFEDLNGDPALRNELFAVICGEANQLLAPGQHTLCGPAFTTETAAPKIRTLRRQVGTLARQGERGIQPGLGLWRTASPVRSRVGISQTYRPIGSSFARDMRAIPGRRVTTPTTRGR